MESPGPRTELSKEDGQAIRMPSPAPRTWPIGVCKLLEGLPHSRSTMVPEGTAFASGDRTATPAGSRGSGVAPAPTVRMGWERRTPSRGRGTTAVPRERQGCGGQTPTGSPWCVRERDGLWRPGRPSGTARSADHTPAPTPPQSCVVLGKAPNLLESPLPHCRSGWQKGRPSRGGGGLTESSVVRAVMTMVTYQDGG